MTTDEINRGFDALGEHAMAIHDHLQTLSESDRKTFMARVEASLATYPPEDQKLVREAAGYAAGSPLHHNAVLAAFMGFRVVPVQ
jgi:hypothetical protein